ncbi:MAG: glycosyltransferase [Ruminococcaceae bacterium]|nr:glycosyltransferase [Oscillospiraceae bacterium]
MPVKLSIGSAVYNIDEPFLRAHIEGILPQLTDETELLLIDDCSTNNSGAVCREYAAKDSRVRYILMEQNGGLSVVRNRTIEEAKGKWIFFADADDLLSEHFVETALHFCDAPYEIIIHERLKFLEQKQAEQPCTVETLTELEADTGRKLSISSLCLDPSYGTACGLSSRAFFHAAWGALYQKAFLEKYNLIFPAGQKKAQDAVFNTEVYYHAASIAYLPYVMYFYRGNPQGITRRYSADLPQIYRRLLSLLSADKERFFAGDAAVEESYRNHRVMAVVIDNMRLNIFHKDNPLSKEERKKAFLAFIEEEPYRSAIADFNAQKSGRYEWLLTVKLIRKKRFALLNLFVGNDRAFNMLSGAYKRLAAKSK